MDEEAQRRKQWWDNFAWLHENATAKDRNARLPSRTTLILLDRLLEEAQTRFEIDAAIEFANIIEVDR